MAAARTSGVNPFTDPAAPRDGSGQAWCPIRIDFGQADALTVRGAGVVGDLVGQVQAFVDRPILDLTGLDGNFEFVATFARSQDPRVDSSAASIFTAFEEELGLKLEPRSAPMEVLEIDSVEMPTPD